MAFTGKTAFTGVAEKPLGFPAGQASHGQHLSGDEPVLFGFQTATYRASFFFVMLMP
jgi:hypothetical protein